jgi:hypothetical protein
MPITGGKGRTREERSLLARLRRPEEIQRFLDEELLYNKEPEGETCRSPRRVIRDRIAHCAEGAFFAASALRFHGHPPLVLTLRAVRDDDHVLSLFRERRTGGAWGAIAKSNYSGLRFREPVYRNLRELVMSYFEGYFNLSAEKTLRAFSGAVDLSRFDRIGWETAEPDLWAVSEYLASRPMRTILTATQIKRLRRVDRRLFEAGLVGRVVAGAP